jgi:hypothetical protein
MVATAVAAGGGGRWRKEEEEVSLGVIMTSCIVKKIGKYRRKL